MLVFFDKVYVRLSPCFDDCKNQNFKGWRTRMETKLRLNADRYDSAEQRMAYVEGRCTGTAALHIAPRRREDAVNSYKDAKDILDHLELIFHDPNEEENARRELSRLWMKPTDDFQTFYENFMRLSTVCGTPSDEYKRNIYARLSDTLRSQTALEMYDSATSFDTFVGVCRNRAKTMETRRQRTAARGRRNAIKRNSSKDNLDPKKPTPSFTAGTGTRTTLSQEERDRRVKLGMCFRCGDQGHISSQCPKKR